MHVPPRIYRRVPFKTAVRLEFDRFRGFIEEYSANLSLGGMFIRTDRPPPMGTVLPIEFRLGNDYELIKGTGRVVWVREEGLDEENPAGIGIRFLELTPGSRELIFRMVERRVREGGVPFDVEQPADLLPGRPPEPGPAPEGEIAATAATGTDHGDDDMPLLAPLPPAAPPPSQPEPSAAAAAEPAAEKAPEQAPERPATPPPATPVAPAAETSTDTREAPRPIVDLPRSTSLPPNLSPFTVEEDEEPARHETPKPSFFTLPEDETDEPAAAASEPQAERAEAEPPATEPPSAAPPSAESPTSAPPVRPLAASPAEQEPVFSFGEDDDSFFPRESAAEPATPAEPQQLDEAESTAEPEETYAAPPEEPVEPPAAAPSAYASTAYRPPTEAGAGVAADAGERPPWRRWVLFGVPLLIALLAGAWVVQDRFLAADDPDARPAAEAGEGDAAPQAVADEAEPEAATGRASGRASGLDVGDVVPETGGEAEEPADDEEDPFGPVTMPDGAPAPGAPGTISEITWSAEGRSTVFLIWTGGPIDQGAVRDFRLDGGNPRHVVRLLGIDQPYTRSEATVGTRQVRRLRTGLHTDREPPEMHVVFDLNGGAEVAQIQARGNQVRIVVTGGAR